MYPSYMYYVYITTNPGHTTLYVGVTNNLEERIDQHYNNRGNPQTYAGRYHCYYLIYFETYPHPYEAILREKEIKKWSRVKKEKLIATSNPAWRVIPTH